MTAETIERWIDEVLAKRARKHVGVAVGVRHRGITVTVGRGRVADDRPAPPDERTIFEIGSITKVLTATLLADLAREGLVRLDDPVQEHLPEGLTIPVRGRPITLADLASHTSGCHDFRKGSSASPCGSASIRTRPTPSTSCTRRSRPRGRGALPGGG